MRGAVLVHDDARIIHCMDGPGRWGVGGWGRPGPANRGVVGDHRPVCNFLLLMLLPVRLAPVNDFGVTAL